jgi:hypothetical protein
LCVGDSGTDRDCRTDGEASQHSGKLVQAGHDVERGKAASFGRLT